MIALSSKYPHEEFFRNCIPKVFAILRVTSHSFSHLILNLSWVKKSRNKAENRIILISNFQSSDAFPTYMQGMIEPILGLF